MGEVMGEDGALRVFQLFIKGMNGSWVDSPDNGSLQAVAEDPLPPLNPMDESLAIFSVYIMTYAAPICLALICIVGVFGNVLVIIVILCKSQMSTANNLLLLNLAMSDILLLVIHVPITIYTYAAPTWQLGDVVCKLSHYSMYVSVYVTVYTLVAVSFLRYLTVVWSNRSLRYRTRLNVIRFVVIIWFVMIIINIPYLFTHKLKYFETYYGYCGLVNEYIAPMHVTFFVTAYAIPMLLICLLYLLILVYLRQNKSHLLTQHRMGAASGNERTTRVYRLILIVIVVFAVCWLPRHIESLVKVYGSVSNSRLYMVCQLAWFCMAYANSCVNPIIYNFGSRDFRKYFKEVIGCVPTQNVTSSTQTNPPQRATEKTAMV